MRLIDLPAADSPTTRAATALLHRYAAPAMANHAIRSALLAGAYGWLANIPHDAELVQVAALLHDLGLEKPFDSHHLPFEEASGHGALAFSAGAGWTPSRSSSRLATTIRSHMLDDVDSATSPEGHLLERATAFDITGRYADLWPPELVADIVWSAPRLDLVHEFSTRFLDQASRKPTSAAATGVQHGLLQRLAGNAAGVAASPDRPATAGRLP